MGTHVDNQQLALDLLGIEHSVKDLQRYLAAVPEFPEGLAEGLANVEQRIARVRKALEDASR